MTLNIDPVVDRDIDHSHMQVSSTDVAIEIIDMHKWFGDFHVLNDINLEVKKGERVVVCGPSGSGKSTMIRCINRLEEHQQGQIIVAGIELEPRAGTPGARGFETFLKCFEAGVLVRSTADTIALSPPLIIEKPQIDQIFETLATALRSLA